MIDSTFDPVASCLRYLDAWRQRDAAAVLATFAPDGHYEDPMTDGPIAGPALAGYAQALWAAMPDLGFELGAVHRVADCTVHAEWTMVGHNHGPYRGLPPTGRAVRVPGIDVFEVGRDGIRRVRGHFDSAAVPRQLGLDVVVQPQRLGPFAFGGAVAVRRDQPVLPRVLAVTELVASSDEHVQQIRLMSRETVVEQLANPDFLGYSGVVIGRRMTTISAWTSHEALSAAMRTGAHAQAMQAFHRDGLAEGGATSVYAPVRQGPFLRRCGGCGAMNRFDGLRSTCRGCGAAVEALA